MTNRDKLVLSAMVLAMVGFVFFLSTFPAQEAEALSNPLTKAVSFNVVCGVGVDGGTQDYTTVQVQPSTGAIPYRSVYCENVSTTPVFFGGDALDYDGGGTFGPPICSDTAVCGATGRSFDGTDLSCTSAGVTVRCTAAE